VAVTVRVGRRTVFTRSMAIFLCLMPLVSSAVSKSFTIADEIELTLFDDPSGSASMPIFSPDGRYFAVWTERGLLNRNHVEDSLRFYRTQDVVTFVKDPGGGKPPSPVWTISASGSEGPIISDSRWLADSSGVAFLRRAGAANQRLVLAHTDRRTIELLTEAEEAVTGFDVHDRLHYVYYIAAGSERNRGEALERGPPLAMDSSGHSLYELLRPTSATVEYLKRGGSLWAVMGGKRFQVKGGVQALSPERFSPPALSPDARSVVVLLPVTEVPSSWETLYPPPSSIPTCRIHGGHQERQSARLIDEYFRVDLNTGSVTSLTGAPYRWASCWGGANSFGGPMWSTDGRRVLLPDTFIRTRNGSPSRPCVAVVDLTSGTQVCVADGLILGARFVAGDGGHVEIASLRADRSSQISEYRSTSDATWVLVGQRDSSLDTIRGGLKISIQEELNEPPRLVATYDNVSRVILDPNPQLKNISLGHADVYTWSDETGKPWKGGLYKPSNFKAGTRYPLVIQTHGFTESEFKPSGNFSTAFAARELAAVGILVLQVGDLRCYSGTPDEGPCAVSGYRAAVKRLVSEGLVDPERIGIIGFSRTCFYVMEALVHGDIRFAAASVTDGVMMTYSQYLAQVGSEQEFHPEQDSIIGAKPFGEGLQEWLRRSPGFNLDKISTPLLITSGEDIWDMWEPYAGLRYLKKPVDFVVLNTGEHVLTNPAIRLASQGGSVDWFSFWLKGQERKAPTPGSGETEQLLSTQYQRWEELCDMQVEENPDQPAFCLRTNAH
jgi:dipeptidyl aminopeptidase/acylaminoacyl peptidase